MSVSLIRYGIEQIVNKERKKGGAFAYGVYALYYSTVSGYIAMFIMQISVLQPLPPFCFAQNFLSA